jgi:predicted patatin/cPLA2 family phospholipase
MITQQQSEYADISIKIGKLNKNKEIGQKSNKKSIKNEKREKFLEDLACVIALW